MAVPPPAFYGTQAKRFISALKSFLGTPYGTGPGQVDCSLLIQDALAKVGIVAPRTSEQQWAWVRQNHTEVNKSQLQPGDLVFSQWPGDNASPGHVQVYIGGGQVIQASHPGAVVSIASLSSDTGHIVGYGRVPGLSGDVNYVAGATADAQSIQTGGNLGGIIGEAGSLLHGIAEMLDFAFGFFAPGQGWRIAFGTAAAGSGYVAVRAYMAQEGSMGGSSFPLAVGAAGVSTLAAFMALRPWPQQAGGPEKPGEYVAEILSGQPPPPGPKRVHETGEIEAGLAVFAVAWLASKAASTINTVISGITSALVGLGLIAAE